VANGEEGWKRIDHTSGHIDYGSRCTDTLAVPGGVIYRMIWRIEGTACMTSVFVPEALPLIGGSSNSVEPGKAS
jgi:hypothetical protein